MAVQDRLITADKFWEIAQSEAYRDKRVELINGVIVEMAPSSRTHTVVAGIILMFLNMFVIPRKLGYVSGADGGFVLSTFQVRQPDVAYISKERGELGEGAFPVAPDLAVEVVSENDRASEIRDKVGLYLNSGTRLVWVVYPEAKIVDVYELREGAQIVHPHSAADALNGGDVLPGFSLPVSDIFPV